MALRRRGVRRGVGHKPGHLVICAVAVRTADPRDHGFTVGCAAIRNDVQGPSPRRRGTENLVKARLCAGPPR